MIIPRLEKSKRSREYELYTAEEHAKVVDAYLFKGLSHRSIDKEILHLDDTYSHGYQSMGILHYLGITGIFKGLFANVSRISAIDELTNLNDPSYNDLIAIISGREISEKKCEEDISAETASTYEVGIEGDKRQYYTTRYERKPRLRKQAIQIHGTTCMACGFNFERVYGDLGKDYIEVHHIMPLASNNEEIEVNPKTDMIVLCANCHRIIHRKKNDILSLEALKKLLEK